MKLMHVPTFHEASVERGPFSMRDLLITAAALVLFLFCGTQLRYNQQPFTHRFETRTLPSNSPCATTEAIATIIISCGNGETDAVAEMRPLLTSIMLLTSIPIRFVFITDNDGVIRIQRMFTELGRTTRPIIVQTVKLSSEWMEQWVAQTKIDMTTHHSGMFGMAKLAAPWLLPDINMSVILDADMVLLKDPALLWSEALQDEGPRFQRGWVYRMMLSEEMARASQICSCVMLVRLQQARDEKIYPGVVGTALKVFPKWFRVGVYKVPHGDQGVFYALWQHDHRLVGHLDTMWNRDHCHKFNGIFDNGNKGNAGILHRNCYNEDHPKRNQTTDGSPPFFDYYTNFPWRWLRAPEGQGCDVVVEGS